MKNRLNHHNSKEEINKIMRHISLTILALAFIAALISSYTTLAGNIEFSDLNKDDWPTVTFTGEQFRAAFENLTPYHRVTLNIAEATKAGKGHGK